MIDRAGLPARTLHWWQRYPWAGLYCGWIVIGALALGVSSHWPSRQA